VELLLVELLTANFDHVLMLFLGLSAIELMMMNHFHFHLQLLVLCADLLLCLQRLRHQKQLLNANCHEGLGC
jgi:hypothetical protein